MFHPCRFSRLRWFTPHTVLQVYCTLQTTIGFAWFRTNAARKPRRRSSRTRYPSKRFPPWQLVAVTDPKVVHPFPIPSRRYSILALLCCHNIAIVSLDLRVLFRQRIRCITTNVAACNEPDAPLGLLPDTSPLSTSRLLPVTSPPSCDDEQTSDCGRGVPLLVPKHHALSLHQFPNPCGPVSCLDSRRHRSVVGCELARGPKTTCSSAHIRRCGRRIATPEGVAIPLPLWSEDLKGVRIS
jgi:hypothetical protein